VTYDTGAVFSGKILLLAKVSEELVETCHY
jgi:hypothetical protein